MKDKILDILINSHDYVSGENISEKLSISRTMVWKYINSLRKEGYKIVSSTNRGYKLSFAPDRIYENFIKENVNTEFIAQNVVYISETDSTNNLAKKNSDYPDGTLFIADVQTAGKGRLGREWKSAGGEGIYMSLLLKPDISLEKVSQITLAAGIAVCKAFREFNIDSYIKWPNDIVVNNKKLCGILTELSAETERVNYVICGIGINVNNTEFPEEIADKAISVCMCSEERYSRNEIIIKTAEYFEKYYKMYLENGISNILPHYKDLCITLDKDVEIIKSGQSVYAKAVDIDDEGGLVVLVENERIVVTSGEVSVRGLLGYC